jgi:uncharacterized membrane protein
MTVVSIVFAILLMTLTLASTQFSPRILISFVRDRTTQGTLGIFLGTFAYCMAALPAARALPHPFVPIATVTGAMVLALVCAGWLIYFINHISHSISVNQLWIELRAKLSWLSTSTCPIREVRSSCQIAAKRPRQSTGSPFSIGSPTLPLYRYQSPCCPGESLPDLLHLQRRVGQFVPAGVALMRVSKPERVPADRALQLIAAFDMGPARTMQQDVEFGIIQIVDIALRAISPAVNDPSTAISCVDQLSRIMILWISRLPPPSHYYARPHVLRLFVPWITFDSLLETAFERIRCYTVADASVSLRLLRAFDDIASTTQHADLRMTLLERARRVTASCRKTNW